MLKSTFNAKNFICRLSWSISSHFVAIQCWNVRCIQYVSDYQLKSACKDAICIAPSKVTQMIFAVLEDWCHHIVLTHSCKLVSFFYIYICCFIAKSWGMSLMNVKSAIAGSVSLPFTFLRQSSIPPVGYRTLDVSTTAAAPITLLFIIPYGNQGWLW